MAALLAELSMLLLLCLSSVEVEANGHMPDMPEYEAMLVKMQKQSRGKPDMEAGARLAGMMEKGPMEMNPEEMGSYMEGDILQPMADPVNDHPDQHVNPRWPDGIVYYQINGQFGPRELSNIQKAMEQYHEHTCVRFRPYTGEQRSFVSIENRRAGCFSVLGRTGGRQPLNLQSPGCLYDVGTPIHELMHALGIVHEQSRADRDSHVHVAWENVQRGTETNFAKSKYTGFGLPYDFSSVMHYSLRAFSVNHQNTLVPRRPTNDQIGQRRGFSPTDIAKVNKLYGCDEANELGPPEKPNPGTYRPRPIPTERPFPQPRPEPPFPTREARPGEWGRNLLNYFRRLIYGYDESRDQPAKDKTN